MFFVCCQFESKGSDILLMLCGFELKMFQKFTYRCAIHLSKDLFFVFILSFALNQKTVTTS
ncbi:hypothetical protein HMPREF1870_02391 [Bacteroidales bacterium KA00344]|nr:hypothetical protein HMPREF1870_02391 [Bacteroidales bacterium KA00344]